MSSRRSNVAALILAASLYPIAAFAHHGWSWTTGANMELTGVIQEARLGNPHGVLTVDSAGRLWTVEVGQPWRNERAGLTDGDLAKGVEATFIGEPAAEQGAYRLKAERLTIDGKDYVLYPERD